MELRFIGCGDAFGSGGRFNTSFLVTGARGRFLIDCGATSLVALKRLGIDPNSINGAVISHLHGDHFAGLVFLLLDAQHQSKRREPFFMLGPPGLAPRLAAAQEALFPGSSTRPERKFALDILELGAGKRVETDFLAVTPFPAEHSAGAPCFALRIDYEGITIAYSGDTGWTENLIGAARDADIFICECSSFAQNITGHLNYATLARRLAEIGAKRVILTHMNPDMLERTAEIELECATDGLAVTL
jgi:ribonuclease BN (tRNA processing enzyme)